MSPLHIWKANRASDWFAKRTALRKVTYLRLSSQKRGRISRPDMLTCLNAVYGEGIEFKKMLVREGQIFPKSR